MQVVFEKEKVKKFRDASEFFRKNSLAYLFFKKRRFYERNLFKNLLKICLKNLHLHFKKLKEKKNRLQKKQHIYRKLSRIFRYLTKTF